MRSGRYGSLVNKALTYLVKSKDPQGTWGSTQATVWSLRTLLAAMDKATGDTNGEVIIKINGTQAGAFALTPKDADVMRQIELRDKMQSGANEIEINFAGKGSALYAISSKYFVPWQGEKEDAAPKPLASGRDLRPHRTRGGRHRNLPRKSRQQSPADGHQCHR